MVHATSIQLREGSVNGLLRWNFSLSKFVSFQVYLFFDGAYAALIDHGTTGFVGVYERFISRFNISWIPPSYYLQCNYCWQRNIHEVWSYGTKISLKVWKCNLKVTIVGIVQYRKWSPTATDPETANDPQNGPQMILDRKWSPKSTANDPVRKIGMTWTQVGGSSCRFYYYYQNVRLKAKFYFSNKSMNKN